MENSLILPPSRQSPRSAPSSISTPSSNLNGTNPAFHKFPDLPLELRLMIWNMTFPNTPRVWEIGFTSQYYELQVSSEMDTSGTWRRRHDERLAFFSAKKTSYVRRSYSPVNRESRNEFLSKFHPVHLSQRYFYPDFSHRVVYINFELDVIYLNDLSAPLDTQQFNSIKENLDIATAKNEIWTKVQNLVISRDLFFWCMGLEKGHRCRE